MLCLVMPTHVLPNTRGVALGDSWVSPMDFLAAWGPYLNALSLLDGAQLSNVTNIASNAQVPFKNMRRSITAACDCECGYRRAPPSNWLPLCMAGVCTSLLPFSGTKAVPAYGHAREETGQCPIEFYVEHLHSLGWRRRREK